MEYEYVSQNEYKPIKSNVEQIIRKVHSIVKSENGLTFRHCLIGSGRRHLITRISGGNKGFDFDYNLILPNYYEYNAKEIKDIFRKAFDKATKDTQYKCAEDSTSVLTIKCIDKKNSKIKHSFDFAITYYDTDNENDGYYYLRNWKNGKYSFEFRKLSVDYAYKLDYILEYDAWNDLRNEYIKLKNRNKDINKHSFILYLEAIANLYNQIKQYEKQINN